MNQQIFQTLQRDPRTSPLANNGQARITTLDDENSRKELEAELTTFVCDGQYGRAMDVILQSYLTSRDRPAKMLPGYRASLGAASRTCRRCSVTSGLTPS